MADKTPPDNPITETLKQAKKPSLKSIDGGKPIKNRQQSDEQEKPATWVSPDGNYQIVHNCFYQVKVNREGDPVKIKLCNFIAEILEETIHEDGLSDKAYFRITGKREDGTTLPEIEVSLTKFPAMSWPGEIWGSRALIYSGTFSKQRRYYHVRPEKSKPNLTPPPSRSSVGRVYRNILPTCRGWEAYPHKNQQAH